MEGPPVEDQQDTVFNNLFGARSRDANHGLLDAQLLNVLDMFPDVNVDFALQVLEHESNDIQRVLQLIADLEGDYPKDDTTDARNDAQPSQRRAIVNIPNPRQAPSYDFSSPTSFVPSHRYQLQSISKLLFDFPFLDHRTVHDIFHANSCHYAIAFDKICDTILAKLDTPMDPKNGRKLDEMLLCVLSKEFLQAQERKLLAEIVKVKRRHLGFSLNLHRSKGSPHVACPILKRELDHVGEKVKELVTALEDGIARRKRRQSAIQDGTAMTCLCCYDELHIEDMVACRDEGHLFCADCLARYVETCVFGNGSLGVTKDKESATEVLCCQGDCTSGYSLWALEKALKQKVLLKYDEMQYHATIEKAGLRENMYRCLKCDLLFELPQGANFFVCPIEGCGFEACRHCDSPPHLGQTCDEVEFADEESGRQRVEEAATEALIRKCPTCRRGILKEDGCNKMLCPCGTKFCYCCLKQIKGYEHFCQTPHCSHSSPTECRYKCPLYTNSFDLENQDRDVVRDAALAEAARVEAETAVSVSDGKYGRKRGSKGVRVDVDAVLALPKISGRRVSSSA